MLSLWLLSANPQPLPSVPPGYTERPARLQFMAGQVVLYSDVTNAL